MLSAPSRESLDDARDEPGVFIDTVVEIKEVPVPSCELEREPAVEEAESDTERTPRLPLWLPYDASFAP